MLLCHCAVISDRTIRELVVSGEVTSVLDVAKQCGAGSFCGGCIPVIESMLATAVGEPSEAVRKSAAPSHQGRGPGATRQVVRDVEEYLAEAGFPVARWLGTERDLARHHGVSVVTMREALQVLDHRGLVVGRKDGCVSGTTVGARIAQGGMLHLLAAGVSTAQTSVAWDALRLEHGERETPTNPVHALLLAILRRTDRVLEGGPETLHDEWERVAVELLLHIRREGLKDGALVGSEHELVDRLDVDAGRLHEMLPVLSHHAIVTRLPGPGQRWVFVTPDPWPAAQAMALHLDRLGVEPIDVFPMRRAIELQTVDLASRRMDRDRAQRLRRRLREESEGRARGQLDYPMFHNIHPLIATFSDNVVLKLFSAAVTLSILRRARAHQPLARHLQGAAAEIAELHEGVVEAVIAGDRERARRLMAFHLDSHSAPNDQV